MEPFRVLRATAAATLTLALAACQYTPKYQINKPADATSIACTDAANTNCSVPIDIQWSGVAAKSQPDMTLDGTPLTITLTSSNHSDVGTFTTAPGSHTFAVSGDLAGNNTIQTYSASSTFTVTPFGGGGFVTLTATPSSVTVTGTSASSVSVGVTLGGGATAPVSVTISPPSQVTASPASLGFSGAGAQPVSISAPASVVANSYSLAFHATATGGSGALSPTLNVLPSVTAAAPTTQRRGGTITLTGTHFDTNCANDKITIGGVAATPTPPCTNTSLTFAVPLAAPSGAATIVVTVNGKASAAFAFTVIPTEVVVVSSVASTITKFSVIDFTIPTSPTVVSLSPNPNIGGMVADCSGTTAAIGSASSGVGQIVMFDISDPAVPKQLPGGFTTNFTQIGAIKFDGSHVLAGDASGSQVVLLDATTPSSLALIAKLQTGVIGIGSTALGGTNGVVSGGNSSTIDIITGIPLHPGTNPTTASFNPNNGVGLTADLSGTSSAIGSKNGGAVKLVNVSTKTILGSQTTVLGSVDSVSISGTMVAAGSNNANAVFLINFATPTAPQVSNAINIPATNSGRTVVLNGSATQLIVGDVNGFDVNLFTITIGTGGKPAATLVKTITTGVGSIQSACVTTF